MHGIGSYIIRHGSKIRETLKNMVFSDFYCLLDFYQTNRHRRQAADLPAKVAKRIRCALKKDVLSTLDGAVLLVEFLVRKSWSIFMSPFHERELLQPVHQPIKWHLNVLPACEPIRLKCMLPTVATCKIKVGWFR